MLSDNVKNLIHYLTPKTLLTQFAGFMANLKIPLIKNYLISRFILKYQVNMTEAVEENPQQYACFNDFFIRQLKPEARPLAKADLVSPVDGFISEFGPINSGQILQAKGRFYTVSELLACEKNLSERFIDGQFATFYLSPKDYHRIHMPVEGRLLNTIYVPGKLFSVQPRTTAAIPQLFARNERLVVFFDTAFGLMALVFVGATIVGSIGTAWQGEIKRSNRLQYHDYQEDPPQMFSQGAEVGYFKLGSTVIALFARREIQWQNELQPQDPVKFGQSLGMIQADKDS